MGRDPGAIKARLSELKNNSKSSVGSLNETNKTQTQSARKKYYDTWRSGRRHARLKDDISKSSIAGYRSLKSI